MKIVDAYCDWAGRKPITIIFEAGQADLCLEDAKEFFDFDDLMDWAKENEIRLRLWAEATYESFRVDQRRAVLDRIHAEDHELRIMPNRQTPRQYGPAFGVTDPKARKKLKEGKDGDKYDACAIRYYARNKPQGFRSASLDYDKARIALREKMSALLMVLRRSDDEIIKPKTLKFGGRAKISQKITFSDNVITLLPDINTLPDLQKKILGLKSGKKFEYRKPLVAVAAVASHLATNRDEYTYLLGAYSHAYPSQARSDVTHHTLYHIEKAHPEVTRGEFQQTVRWLGTQLKDLDVAQFLPSLEQALISG